jgi:hypothetical protein
MQPLNLKTLKLKVKQALSGGMGISGRGEDTRKGCRRVNMVEIYTHVYKWKNETC